MHVTENLSCLDQLLSLLSLFSFAWVFDFGLYQRIFLKKHHLQCITLAVVRISLTTLPVLSYIIFIMNTVKKILLGLHVKSGSNFF